MVTEPDERDLLEYAEALARQQRRRRFFGIAVLGAVAVAASLVYLLWPKPVARRCKPDQVRAYLRDRSLPAEAVHLACRLPAPLHRVLRESLAAPPRQRALLVLGLVSTAPELFTPVCAEFPEALAAALRVPPARQSARLLERCDLSRAGFAPRADLEAAPLARLVLAVAIHHALRESDPQHAAPLAREICCRGR